MTKLTSLSIFDLLSEGVDLAPLTGLCGLKELCVEDLLTTPDQINDIAHFSELTALTISCYIGYACSGTHLI